MKLLCKPNSMKLYYICCCRETRCNSPIKRLLVEFSQVEKFNTDSMSCGAYTQKLFRCAPFVRNAPSVFAILRGRRGIYKKIISLRPVYHRKGDLTVQFFSICPSIGKKEKIFKLYGLMWGTGEEFFCICPNQVNSHIFPALDRGKGAMREQYALAFIWEQDTMSWF